MTDDFKKATRPLRNGYVFFIVIILLTLIVSQFIIQYKLDTTNEDASLINIAGRQRMYSQRISKQVYNVGYSITSGIPINNSEKDTLQSLTLRFKKAHNILLKGNDSLGLLSKRSENITNQLRALEPYLNKLCSAAESLVTPNADSTVASNAIATIEKNSVPFLLAMESVVNSFETEAEKKHGNIKVIVLVLMVLAIVATILAFVFIFMPTISKLNKGSKLIKETTDRLFLATSTAKIGIWEYDVLSDTLVWDETMYEMYNMPYKTGGEQNMIRKWMATIHKDDVRRVKKELYASLNTGIPINSEFRIVWQDGSEHFILAKAAANFDSKGKVVTLTGTNFDLTELRHAEEQLLKANVELQALLDSGNYVSTISTDLRGKITLFSKGAETLLGYTAEEMVGKQTPAIIHIEEEVIKRGEELSLEFGKEVRGFDVFVEYAKQGKYESREWTYKRKDGTTFPVQLVVTGIKNKDDELIGFLGIATDISKQKEKAKELEETISIVGEQNKRLLNFAYIVSHNLRSHSGNIDMILGIIEDPEDDEEREEMIKQLRKVSNNLSETIRHLNDVVYINTNLSISKEKLNLKQYADETIDTLKSVLNSANGKIINNIPNDVEVYFNVSYMESVILNFLTNGLKYKHPDRNPEVVLDVYYENNEPVLKISDNGLGIDLEKYGEKLFGMYKTFHGNADAKGIGLFITKNQIEAMGGSITVESEVNKGTTFRIFFNKPNKF